MVIQRVQQGILLEDTKHLTPVTPMPQKRRFQRVKAHFLGGVRCGVRCGVR